MFGFKIVKDSDLQEIKARRDIVWNLIQKIGDACFDKDSTDDVKLAKIQDMIVPLASAQLEDDIALTMILIKKH